MNKCACVFQGVSYILIPTKCCVLITYILLLVLPIELKI